MQYDHKRCHAERSKGQRSGNQYRIWDFVLTRDDESFVTLHPQYSSTKVECKLHWPTFDGELPRTGIGGIGLKGRASNPGTFKHFISKGVDNMIRFDPTNRGTRGNARPQSRVHWTNVPQNDGPAMPGSGGASASGLWQ